MSKHQIAVWPQDQYRFRIFDNGTACLHDWEEVMEAAGPDCAAAINLAYFALADIPSKSVEYFDHQSAIMVAGKWGIYPQYHEHGICINADGHMTLGTEKDAVYDYAVGLPPAVINGADYNTTRYGANGVTYTGLCSDGAVVTLLCSKDNGTTSHEAVSVMREAGCIHIFRWDGSWSSRGYLGPGKEVTPSQWRMVRSWLLIFKRKQEKDSSMKKVCLDPGHGVETPGKCSPDKTYYEHEFTLDLAKRMKPILERHGVEVTLTRTDEHCPTGKSDTADLNYRVKLANAIEGLNLFVSIHSNAAGNDGWYSAKGLSCITSAAGDTAGRNLAANAIIARMKEAGITVRNTSLTHDIALIVLRKTDAPAVLIEHGFHTNKEETELLKTAEYRDALAEAECKGILDYLGIAWSEDYGKTVQERFGLSDDEIAYLYAYENAGALLKTLATKN